MHLWGGMTFQDAYHKIGEYLSYFHEGVMCLIIFILSVVLFMLWAIIAGGQSCRTFCENQVLEVGWTVAPFLCLVGVGLPSMHLLYLMDEIGSPLFSFKAIGHQWYWSYEFLGDSLAVIGFDSFMLVSEESGYRLLDVDQRMVVPSGVGIRCMVSSSDVIHSFALPGCMMKVDAIPGRINEISFNLGMSGVLYGQCSEICGANHSFMPIVIEAIPVGSFNGWHETVSKQASLMILE